MAEGPRRRTGRVPPPGPRRHPGAGPVRRRPALPAPPRLGDDRRRPARRPRRRLPPAAGTTAWPCARWSSDDRPRLRRGRRRRPGGRRLDRAAAGPGRRPGARPRAVGVRERHVVHPRPDAGRRAPADPVGAARPGRRCGHPGGAQHDVPLRRRRVAAGDDPAARRGGRAVRPAPARGRPDPRGRRSRGRRRRSATAYGSPGCCGTGPAGWPAYASSTRPGATPRSRRRTSWARTGSARWSRTRPAPPSYGAGAYASAVRYAYLEGLDASGYEWRTATVRRPG